MEGIIALPAAAEGQLSRLSRRALLGFLLGLSLLLVYVLVALWAVDFPDAHSPKPAVLAGDGPAGAGRIWIEQLDPDQVASGSTHALLAIHGYSFTPAAKVL